MGTATSLMNMAGLNPWIILWTGDADEPKDADVLMREATVKRGYTLYSDQDKDIDPSFLKATMDEMDKYPHMKGHYLVMDKAPIHKSEDIQKYIKSRKYRYAYLPSYSPELKPIEQFWSVVKSRVKRNRLLERETLMTRISEISVVTESSSDMLLTCSKWMATPE
ncbi:hypothetical protein VTP01DRAFT_8097 [Rhizomucor pusillus]|uniref:uncharacterized protein n=1 Tax=Rhizomucor pusillus TaxID=4840 RepID=UPI0037421637